MKKLILLILLVLTSTFTFAAGNDTIAVVLSKNITVNWSVKNAKVVQDDTFLKLKANKKAIKAELYELVADVTDLGIEACFKKTGTVKKGDVAFYLFDVLYNVPYQGVLGQKFDQFLLSCTPPQGLYDYIDANRAKVVADMRAFYTKQM
jgi:cell division protein FtsB